ncbi:Peptide deformylase 2 [Candidatus Terasakiella magnetica]|uniref:Peptide deformylase n=1 Tax=Candidatus Terasakiella magnetica TaxID=1867952 RepID=A0A1C3REK8_9PROT|nr:peptide deformylase [Candidatus Terasakiella magnetica]SCA55736.1 Peptide deformylase 2 [Candidatus Terasakiella magnetica]
MILKIARMGHPVLKTIAAPVEDPTAPEIEHLVSDMIETMEDATGAGLAAPQVHVPLRVVIFHVPRGRDVAESSEDEIGLTVLINPEIEPMGEEKEAGYEGCLSIPTMTGKVSRYSKIKYRGYGLDGELIEREATGFHARVVQHECDHLDGILYPQRMDDMGSFGYVEEMQKAASQD